jgi:predicted acylesterase/phospholipase RssA
MPCPLPDTLVLSGGGMKGVAMLGAVDRMQAAGMLSKVRTVVGTSAGALVGALVATKRDLKGSLSAMQRHTYCPDFDFDRFGTRYGLDSGDSLVELMGALMPPFTFEEVRREHGISLVVCVTNVSKRCAEYFGPDTHPNVPIALAIRMSCSVPLYFAAVKHDENWYVDGSIVDNFPCDWAAKHGAERIVGVTTHGKAATIGNFEGFVMALVDSVVASQHTSRAEVLSLDLPGASTLNFGAPPSELLRLFATGAAQADAFMKKRA